MRGEAYHLAKQICQTASNPHFNPKPLAALECDWRAKYHIVRTAYRRIALPNETQHSNAAFNKAIEDGGL